MHHHRVHGAFHIGNQPLGRNQAGVNAQLDTFGGFFGNTQQLDAVAQLLGVFDVLRAELGDAFDVGLVKLHRHAKCHGRHQADLVGRIHPLDVKGRVRFCITQALCFFEHHVKVQAFVAHFTQDEVGGAVDDAGNPLNTVGAQAFAQ